MSGLEPGGFVGVGFVDDLDITAKIVKVVGSDVTGFISTVPSPVPGLSHTFSKSGIYKLSFVINGESSDIEIKPSVTYSLDGSNIDEPVSHFSNKDSLIGFWLLTGVAFGQSIVINMDTGDKIFDVHDRYIIIEGPY